MDSKSFFYQFGKALYHVDAVYEEFAKQSGVASPTMLWILYALGDGSEHTQREICLDWDLPKSTVNTVMSDLKKKGYVELIPIKGKRREMNIVLTDQGKEYAEKLLSDIYKKEAEVFSKLDEQDLKVIECLEKITMYLRGEKE
ncbi:MAG: MarR family winged helix-turn-helix transcriptional regulator [Erysipelotrichaceae bacterium]|nr:MarR family winged helix-turn-helix transcriptional regulator [Erysipelotrichaceae bacterium]